MIIERPRLMKKLDESTARTILLLAPAGYGKTTLARQWRATLQHAVWVTLTPAHRDVTVIARDLAESLEEAGDEGFRDFIEQYIRARPNPQGDAALSVYRHHHDHAHDLAGEPKPLSDADTHGRGS